METVRSLEPVAPSKRCVLCKGKGVLYAAGGASRTCGACDDLGVVYGLRIPRSEVAAKCKSCRGSGRLVRLGKRDRACPKCSAPNYEVKS